MKMAKTNSCYGYDGKPKHAYATYIEASGEALKHAGYNVYQCREHGFHIGGELSRALRNEIALAKHAKKKGRLNG